MSKDRRKTLDMIFADVDSGEKALIDNLLDEVCFLEDRMTELKKLPFVSVHPHRPELQKSTAAAKQYKECAANYANIMRILLNVLRKVESTEMNSLLSKLNEFEL